MSTYFPYPPSAPTRSGIGISFTPVAMTHRATLYRRQAISFGISTIISVLLLGLFMWQFEMTPKDVFFWIIVASALITVVRLIIAIIESVRASRRAARLDLGPALQIDHDGLIISDSPGGRRIAWDQVTNVRGRSARMVPGPRLVVTWEDAQVDQTPTTHEWDVPLVLLDTHPQDIDAALRAFSLGRIHLDLSSLDEIW